MDPDTLIGHLKLSEENRELVAQTLTLINTANENARQIHKIKNDGTSLSARIKKLAEIYGYCNSAIKNAEKVLRQYLWRAADSGDGKTYYWNIETRERQWDKPVVVDIRSLKSENKGVKFLQAHIEQLQRAIKSIEQLEKERSGVNSMNASFSGSSQATTSSDGRRGGKAREMTKEDVEEFEVWVKWLNSWLVNNDRNKDLPRELLLVRERYPLLYDKALLQKDRSLTLWQQWPSWANGGKKQRGDIKREKLK